MMFNPIRSMPLASSISRNYVLPALILNPILFLHSLNTILSRILPPVVVQGALVQPLPYSSKGPSAEHPHMDVHASDRLCWSYTIFMVGMQLVAFGRVSMSRTQRRERLEMDMESKGFEEHQKIGWGMDGASDKTCGQSRGTTCMEYRLPDCSHTKNVSEHPWSEVRTSDVGSHRFLEEEKGCSESEESEVIL